MHLAATAEDGKRINGCRVMAAAVKLREVAYPGLYAAAA
jgi:hypothetical protein